ncbi:MAG: flagellar basal body rod protein FlgC [Oscillospiraceae bacterium]|jgi:flagellar basal-body rod protein FlgC|nr:flagellar basal body rod protein FlgC [Oscillospiraceae bacterium]
MAFLESMNISASALTATRLRMDVVSENIANSSVTRTADGGPYRRKYVVYQSITDEKNDFNAAMSRSERAFGRFRGKYGDISGGKADTAVGGVRVVEIGEDQSEFKLQFDPSHPDAGEDGYVRMPNIDVVQEMVDMMSAYRAYEANITAINGFKDMALKTLEIGK